MNEAALRARSLTLADGQVVVPIEDVLDLTATPSGGPLDRIHALRKAINDAVDELNETWGGFGPNEQLEHAIGVLQRARTADDIAQGRDWPPVVLGTETQRPAATPSGGPLDTVPEWVAFAVEYIALVLGEDNPTVKSGRRALARLTGDAG